MTQRLERLPNPYRPGAGHMPPFLAGRDHEKREFGEVLLQEPVLKNIVLTGLRGVGKTVLLESFKPLALDAEWVWVGTDLSEAASVTELNLIIRFVTDLSVVTRSLIGTSTVLQSSTRRVLDFQALMDKFQGTPGLTADKFKAVLSQVWTALEPTGKRGIVFAYDEAQTLADHPTRHEYPLSLVLDVFQSLQRQGVPIILVLTGLPTLFPKLVEARTYAERMFHVLSLGPLDKTATRQAILTPIEDSRCPVRFSADSIATIAEKSSGYPYFIQYICRECFDIWVSNVASGEPFAPVPMDEIIRKLDADFFAGRWSRATDRQRDLLWAIASLENAAGEFSVHEIVESGRAVLNKPFSSSHVNQMLSSLSESGLVYKNRWGKYSLAVPLLDRFILRVSDERRVPGMFGDDEEASQ